MADVKIWKVDEAFLDTSCSLGEGPFYEDYSNRLRFVDMEKRELHYVDLGVGPASHRVKKFDQKIMTVTNDLQGDNDRFLFVGKDCVGIYTKSSGEYEAIKDLWSGDEIHKAKTIRGNDGNCDAAGHFFFGVMSDPMVKDVSKEGTVFRLDPDLTLHRILEPITIPNGISWTDDNKTMYWTDSADQAVYAFDYDLESAAMSNKRVFWKPEEGVPDGHAMDVEEHLWVANFGAGKVVRLSPAGKVVAEIHLPTRSITCPEFAEDVLYITTAKEEDPEKYPESAKNQGKIYSCKVGVRGKPNNRFPLKT